MSATLTTSHYVLICFFPDVIKEHTYILKNPVPSPQVQITLENPGLPVMILSHNMAVCRLARVQFGLGLGVLGPYVNLHPEVWFRQVVNTNPNLMFRFGMFISGFKQCSLSKKNQQGHAGLPTSLLVVVNMKSQKKINGCYLSACEASVELTLAIFRLSALCHKQIRYPDVFIDSQRDKWDWENEMKLYSV